MVLDNLVLVLSGPAWARGLVQVTSRGPFHPQPSCNVVIYLHKAQKLFVDFICHNNLLFVFGVSKCYIFATLKKFCNLQRVSGMDVNIGALRIQWRL